MRLGLFYDDTLINKKKGTIRCEWFPSGQLEIDKETCMDEHKFGSTTRYFLKHRLNNVNIWKLKTNFVFDLNEVFIFFWKSDLFIYCNHDVEANWNNWLFSKKTSSSWFHFDITEWFFFRAFFYISKNQKAFPTLTCTKCGRQKKTGTQSRSLGFYFSNALDAFCFQLTVCG